MTGDVRLLAIVENSRFAQDVAELQRLTDAVTMEAAIEQAVAREVNLLRKLETARSVRIFGLNPDGDEIVYSR
jgi:hypothetical protein